MGFQVPDWLVPDLEDGTALGMKQTTLENTVELSIEHGPSFGGEV